MSRHKRSSLAEDLAELAALLPWWLSLILAPVSYTVLHAYAATPVVLNPSPGQVGSMMNGAILKGLATGGQYILPIILVTGAVLSLLRRRKREALVQSVADNASGGALRSMSWQDFELLVGEAFRLRGYAVAETGGGGADGGIDVELRRGKELFLVQCKQWRAYKVSVTVVRELYGVMAARGAAGGFVVTSGAFTADAEAFARGRNIELIDGSTLAGMIERAKGQRPATMSAPVAGTMPAEMPASLPAAKPATTPAADAVPACPKCGSPMVRRTARQGARAGDPFWGCGSYPKCRGVRAIG